jgi:hypothetical protein
MSSTPPQTMITNFEDPRSCAGFLPQFYPTANRKAAPPVDSTDRNDRIALEFLATYYHLNCQYSRLVQIRKEPNSSQRNEAERKCLQDIEKILIVRDALEDHYAPFGVIADPTIRDGFTVNLKISFGNADAAGRERSELYTLTAFVPIPLPRGAKLGQLPFKIEGPGINGEY